MKIGSLFSGIGGLELGLERAGLGETIWQVEIDPGCRKILERHWPSAKRFSDVAEVGASELEPIDLICGGFPCQDVSSAGKRAGLSGSRSGLWFEYLRIVRELRPQWVVVENVASGAAAWVDPVLAGLEEQGYACLPIPLSAADVGAPHLRRRVFVIAHLDKGGQSLEPQYAEVEESPKFVADTNSPTVRFESGQRERTSRESSAEPTFSCWASPQPNMVRVADGLPRRLDKSSARIAALGNAVVPQCAEVVGHIIRELNRP
jgi:DNA (cytosine-5)-methyltransferase 1